MWIVGDGKANQACGLSETKKMHIPMYEHYSLTKLTNGQNNDYSTFNN